MIALVKREIHIHKVIFSYSGIDASVHLLRGPNPLYYYSWNPLALLIRNGSGREG
jgi:hypothetical protein